MTQPTETALNAARQWVETGRLLGVPFVPVSMPASAPDSTPAADAHPPKNAESRENQLRQLEDRYRRDVAAHIDEYPFENVVFGEGDPNARLMFVGEGPGVDEDRLGRPFVGRAGKKLDEMITAMGLRREDVYIANIVKVRPPGNRTPLTHEVDRCSPFLREQIRIIRPEILVPLGGAAAKWLLDTKTGVTRLRGVWATYEDGDVATAVLPTFHPAYLLRNYTVETRQQVWNDLQAVVQRLQETA